MTGSRRALLLLAALAVCAARAQGPELPPPFDRAAPPGDPPAVPGVATKDQPEVQGRGPLHEGFAQPSDPTARPAPVVPKAPPEPVREAPPEQKPEGDNVVWIPGYWMWDDDRRDFLWVSGFWRVPPPNRKWVPGYWAKAEGGHRWVSGFWAVADQPAVPYTESPPATLEIGPNQPAPDESYQWIPGSWLPRDERWFWRPGFWVAPRPGWVFTPARHCWTPRGYVFVGGFWDRDLLTRGLPFAPVYIPPSLCASPNFVYTPTYTLSIGACLGSLWARPGWGYYAFGDYYGAGYGRLGYQPWFNYGPRVRDPLFGYYRNAQLRRNPNWAAGLATTYQSRVNGTLPLPPRTFAAQARLANPAAATLLPMASYRNPALPLVQTPVAERAAVERTTSAYLRAKEERLPAPGGTRPGVRPLADIPAPVIRPRSPAAIRGAELARPPAMEARPALTLPPPREALRAPPPPAAVVPRSAPRSILPPATRFSMPPSPRFTLPPPRAISPGRLGRGR